MGIPEYGIRNAFFVRLKLAVSNVQSNKKALPGGEARVGRERLIEEDSIANQIILDYNGY